MMGKDVVLEPYMGNLPTGKARPRRLSHEDERRATLGRVARTGDLRLKKLSTTHQTIIAMYLTGDYSIKEISEELAVSRAKINKILLDPLAQKIINEFREAENLELQGLQGIAVEAVRKGLRSQDTEMRLKAVDRYVKLKQDSRGQGPSEGGTTVNVTINNAREKFVDLMKDVTPKAPEIDG